MVSVYIDVKRLYDVLAADDANGSAEMEEAVDTGMLKADLLRKHFLGAVLAELIKELNESLVALSLLDRLLGKKKTYAKLKANLQMLKERVEKATLVTSEIPILQKITRNWKSRSQKGNEQKVDTKSSLEVSTLRAPPREFST